MQFPSPTLSPPQTIIHQDSNWNHINLHTNFGSVDTILSFLWYCVKVARSCLTLCDPMVYTVHGILQPRVLEWVVFLFSRGSSQPSNRTGSLTLQADSWPTELWGKLMESTSKRSEGSRRETSVFVTLSPSTLATGWQWYCVISCCFLAHVLIIFSSVALFKCVICCLLEPDR